MVSGSQQYNNKTVRRARSSTCAKAASKPNGLIEKILKFVVCTVGVSMYSATINTPSVEARGIEPPFPTSSTGPFNPFPTDLKGNVIDHIGEHHNRALHYLYGSCKSNGKETFCDGQGFELSDVVKTMYKYATEARLIESDVAGMMLSDYGNFGIGSSGDKILTVKVLESNIKDRRMKQRVLDMVEASPTVTSSSSDIKAWLKKQLNPISRLANKGNEQAKVFVDVAWRSFEYWSETQPAALKDGSDVIIADAVGALHGLILGPIVSIIEGAAVSVAKNEGWI